MHFHYDDEFCTCGWRVVDELDAGGGYDWHVLMVLADASGRLHWVEGAGCSCNDRSDIEESELAPINKTVSEFRAAVRDFPTDPTEKPRMLARVAGSRFGVSTFLDGNTVTVYA